MTTMSCEQQEAEGEQTLTCTSLCCFNFSVLASSCFLSSGLCFFFLLIDWEHKRFSLLIIKMQEGLYLRCCGPASMHQIKNKSLFCFGIWQ
jgi:hypothetical protein